MELYEKYIGRVQFVIVVLDRNRSAAQRDLLKKYYRGYIPHVTMYDQAGEVDESALAGIRDKTLS